MFTNTSSLWDNTLYLTHTLYLHIHIHTIQDWELQAATLKKQGDTSFSTGDYSSAIKHYTSAISIDDSNAVLYSNRAACLLKVNERSRALRDGERCVELKPDWGKGYGRKAAAQFSLKRYEAAADTYREGLAKDPDNKALKEGLNDAKRKAREAEEEEQRRKEEEQRKEVRGVGDHDTS